MLLSKDLAKEKVKALIEYYASKKQEFSKFSEQDIRLKLIDKLFKILGWDLDGEENPDEVQREEGISNKESAKKKADYVFRLSGVPKFVVEAKAIKGIDMDSEIFREQVIGYAYNLACSWGILTNFETTTIFYVDRDDKTSIRRISDISNLINFDRNFESLWFLSKESVKDELLEREVEKMGIKVPKEKVGKQLFEDLKEWRKKISDDLKKTYDGKYKPYEIEEIVQRVIDRLIFIRKLEDMELEERRLEQLNRKFSDKSNHYNELKIIFKYYRDKYNSGLFGHNGEEQECDNVAISNNPIAEVIHGMYSPKGRNIEYNFAAIDADILGNIYEQYLAFILQDTPKKTKLEGGRTHRKEQGIYYTPTYIVDYIVKNTVVEYIKHKDIDEILHTKILDPACGSGSFLIKAFSEVCKIVDEKLTNGERAKKSTSFSDYRGRLTLHQKVAILTSCIYGVDLDKKAVEIAQLNLLFKLLEGETAESLANLKETKKLLPMLNNNIKNGNSLIDDSDIAGDVAFNWNDKTNGFGEIVQLDSNGNLKEGYGFDVVIGNPPYVKLQTLEKRLIEYFFKNYTSATKHYDLYILFVEQGFNVLKADVGLMGYILPSKFLNADYGIGLRKIISKNKSLYQIVDFGDHQIFDGATTYTCLLFLRKNKNNSFVYLKLKEKEKLQSDKILSKEVFIRSSQDHPTENEGWSFTSTDNKELLEKLNKVNKTLGDVSEDIFQGFLTGRDRIFFVSVIENLGERVKVKNLFDDRVHIIEKGILKKLLKGKEIKRWKIDWKNNYLIYPYKNNGGDTALITIKNLKENYPDTYQYLLSYKKQLMSSDTSEVVGENNWYRFRRARSINQFESEKIITQVLASRNSFAWDNNENYYFVGGGNAGGFGIILKKEYSEMYSFILAILNSKLLEFFLKKVSTPFRGGFYSYGKRFIERLPILIVSKSEQKPFIQLVDKMLFLNKKLKELGDKKTDERTRIEKEITEMDEKIDEEVYKLYGITDGEKKIIEENLK